jgi:hypothetical protein
MSPATEVLAGVDLDQLCTNTIRTLSIGAVQRPSPDTRARPWRWRRSSTRSGIACSAANSRL